MLIVLEGLDGAGKSTQLKMVSNYMEARGHKVEYLHFPRFDAPVFGDLIAGFLRGDFGSIEQVHPQLVALLFAEDRRDAAPMLRNWLDEGRCVVLDRYYYSNIAFQCSKFESAEEARRLRDWIIDVELGHFGIPAPDLNLFLDVPINFVDSKLSASRQGKDRAYLEGKNDIHEADIDFQVKVRNIYLEQCALDKNFKRIDCSDGYGNMLPANEIFIKIRTELEALS